MLVKLTPGLSDQKVWADIIHNLTDGVNGTTNAADGTITGINDMAHDSGRASQGTEVNI